MRFGFIFFGRDLHAVGPIARLGEEQGFASPCRVNFLACRAGRARRRDRPPAGRRAAQDLNRSAEPGSNPVGATMLLPPLNQAASDLGAADGHVHPSSANLLIESPRSACSRCQHGLGPLKIHSRLPIFIVY